MINLLILQHLCRHMLCQLLCLTSVPPGVRLYITMLTKAQLTYLLAQDLLTGQVDAEEVAY